MLTREDSSCGRSQPSLSQLDIQELVGNLIHMEPDQATSAGSRCSTPETVHPFCLCVRPPGGLPPPHGVSCLRRSQTRCSLVSSPRALELGISNR